MATTKIRSSSILDGQVANADLSATVAVTGGQIADDAITLAKMAGGTDGNLITYDASGDPAYVATGSATNVLTSNGAGAAPTFQAVASASNTPSWGMKPSTYKASMASQTWQSVNFDTEMWNVGGGTIDTVNYTYTIASGEGGKYNVGVWVYGGSNAGVSTLYEFNLRLRRTPSGGAAATIAEYTWDIRNAGAKLIQSGGDRVLDLTAGDLLQVEGYCHITTGAAQGIFQDSTLGSQFYGYKLLEYNYDFN